MLSHIVSVLHHNAWGDGISAVNFLSSNCLAQKLEEYFVELWSLVKISDELINCTILYWTYCLKYVVNRNEITY